MQSNMTTATTDTPRTDALDFGWGVHTGEIWDLSRQLERELAASKAEVERLKEQLTKAIGIAEWYMDNLIDSPRKVALDEIKLTLNADNK